MAGIGMVGAQETPVGGSPGPAAPGQTYQFNVTPDAEHRFLSIAFMVVETNDVFVAFEPQGVALLDVSGTLHPTDDISANIRRSLAVWDAGTDANEVPGVGLNQPMRQAGLGLGFAAQAGLTGCAEKDTESPLTPTLEPIPSHTPMPPH
jgi:hypothetical protein